jgi:ATP-dependent DNA ligase
MLARTLSLAELPARCADGGWSITQKADGERCLVFVGAETFAVNRRGERMPLPRWVEQCLSSVSGDLWLDGELIKGKLWLFDMPQAGPPERRLLRPSDPYIVRRGLLEDVFAQWNPPDTIQLLPRGGHTTEDRLLFVKKMLENGAEGVMLNNIHAPYEPGVRSRQLLKAKFVKQIDCVILDRGRDGKQNFVLALYRDGHIGRDTEVGEVSALTGDGPSCNVGDVVTVTFLYTLIGSDRLVQPVTPKLRSDKAPEECTWDQLEGTYTTKEIILP